MKSLKALTTVISSYKINNHYVAPRTVISSNSKAALKGGKSDFVKLSARSVRSQNRVRYVDFLSYVVCLCTTLVRSGIKCICLVFR